MKESDLQTQILEWLLWRGYYAWRQNNLAPMNRKFRGMRGLPDIIVILPPNGQFVGIEVKSGRGIQSKHQEIFQKNLEKLGGIYILAKSLKDVEEVL